MQLPVLSVIVPIYNKGKYLAKCLDSIINQTLESIEIICVNDGSTDNCAEILEKYAQKDSRIRIITTENRGAVEARKEGIINSKADLIGFVDADDWIDRDMYETMYNEMVTQNVDLVSIGIMRESGLCSFDALPEKIYKTPLEKKELFTNMILYKNTMKNGIIPNTVTKIYRKDLLINTSRNIDKRIRLHDDDCLVYSYIIKCNAISILNRAFYHANIVENSLGRAMDTYALGRINLFYNYLKEAFSESEYKDELIEQLDLYMVETIRYVTNHLLGIKSRAYFTVQYPMKEFSRDEKVIIYGIGTVGLRVMQLLNEMKDIHIVAFADKYRNEKEIYGYRVIKPQNILEENFDKILIAVKDKDINADIKNELMNIGIEEKKIVCEII